MLRVVAGNPNPCRPTPSGKGWTILGLAFAEPGEPLLFEATGSDVDLRRLNVVASALGIELEAFEEFEALNGLEGWIDFAKFLMLRPFLETLQLPFRHQDAGLASGQL